MNAIEGDKSDADRAQEFKKKMLEVLTPVIAVLDSARAAGPTIEYT